MNHGDGEAQADGWGGERASMIYAALVLTVAIVIYGLAECDKGKEATR